MTHAVTVLLSLLGVAGMALAGALLVVGALALFRVRGPLDAVRQAVWGYELWAAFVVAAIATGGSLFFSDIAHFVPCELCWYQRICMYPLSIVTLLAALARDDRVARYLLPLPAVGACVSVYHLFVQEGVFEQTNACLVSAPGGCATKWIEEFGFVTIPALALTGFALELAFLGMAATNESLAFENELVEEEEASAEPDRASSAAWAIVAVVAVAAAAAVGWVIGHNGRSASAAETVTVATTQQSGAAVFAEAGCGSCHTLKAANATGSVGPDLDALNPSRRLVATVVRSGAGGGSMPAFGDRLSDAQIDAVAGYVASAAGGG